MAKAARGERKRKTKNADAPPSDVRVRYILAKAEILADIDKYKMELAKADAEDRQKQKV